MAAVNWWMIGFFALYVLGGADIVRTRKRLYGDCKELIKIFMVLLWPPMVLYALIVGYHHDKG